MIPSVVSLLKLHSYCPAAVRALRAALVWTISRPNEQNSTIMHTTDSL